MKKKTEKESKRFIPVVCDAITKNPYEIIDIINKDFKYYSEKRGFEFIDNWLFGGIEEEAKYVLKQNKYPADLKRLLSYDKKYGFGNMDELSRLAKDALFAISSLKRLLRGCTECKKIIKHYLLDNNLFPISVRSLRCAFTKTLKKSGIEDLHFQDLRHTFATRLVQNGLDLYRIKELLGHKSIIMTMRYAHHYPESLRSSIEILDRCRSVSRFGHGGGKNI